MKRALLIFSLLANVALAVVYIKEGRKERAEQALRATAIGPRNPKPSSISLDAKAWARVETGSGAEIVARLRSEGFPPEVIRTIIEFRLTEQFAQRRAAILAKKKPIEFWKYRNANASGPTAGLDASARAQLRALDDEQARLRRELLGSSFEPTDEIKYQKRQYGDLPEATVRRIEAINKDYRELSIQTRDEMQGILLPQDREKIKFLEKERRADLAAVLTPEQLESFDLRSSATASQLQSRLTFFKPSEDEYKALYSLQRTFDDQYGRNDLTPDEEKRRNAAQPELLEQMKAALGPERFAEYQITTDPLYRQTQYFVSGSGLPEATASQLVAIQQDISKKASAVKSDSNLTAEQRDAQLFTLSLQASTQVTSILGDEAAARYKNSAGTWLGRIKPSKSSGNTR